MYIYHLHSWLQIGQEKYYNGVCIRFLMEDIIYADNNNLDFLDLIYGTASRYDLRSKIYPSFMTYRKWIELSNNYPKIILSLNFDVHSYKYKEFCKKVLKQFPRNKNIIVSAANECYEKRGEAEKVYQTSLEVYQAMQEIGKFYPIAFWNEKIYTSGEISALEKLLNDKKVKDICEYFGFQSLGTSNSKVEKYVKMAKEKGFKGLDIELGTITQSFSEIEYKFKKDKNLGIDDVVILTPGISEKLSNNINYPIWKKYALSINGEEKDKYKLINYIQQFKTKEEGMKIADEYKFEDKNDKVIDWIQAKLYFANYLSKPIIFGNFDKKTEEAVMSWQEDNNVVVTGVITKYHITLLMDQFIDPATKQLNPEKAFRELMVYAS